MNYQHVVRDFAERTRSNLHLLRKLQEDHPNLEIYEVTQLINSMLGLLVFPRESYVDRIPKTPLSELADQGWPMPKVVGNYPQVEDLRDLIRYLRNAIAHFNVEFLADGRGQITGLQVWNEWQREITWKARLSLHDIELITEKFLDLLLQEQPKRSPARRREESSKATTLPLWQTEAD